MYSYRFPPQRANLAGFIKLRRGLNSVRPRQAQGELNQAYHATYRDPIDSLRLRLCDHCFHCLQAAPDTTSLPDRSRAFEDVPELLGFAGQFHEVNSQS